MLTSPELLEDIRGYGTILRAWKGTRDLESVAHAPGPGPLPFDDVLKFTSYVYALVKTDRQILVYRFYETADLRAPYGEQHNSFTFGQVSNRHPAQRMGRWWTPSRPGLTIDRLGYSDDHRKGDRATIAVKKEWNRFDYCVEAELVQGSLIYAGRTAMQNENRSFETDRGRTITYGGGAIQFKLVEGFSLLHVHHEYENR
jgi:hypothetical protein